MKNIKARWCFIEMCVSLNNTTLREQKGHYIVRPETYADIWKIHFKSAVIFVHMCGSTTIIMSMIKDIIKSFRLYAKFLEISSV